MNKPSKEVNRFGKEITTDIPDDAPLITAGHKLRTTNQMVDRKALSEATDTTLIPLEEVIH
ncbi:MAG: hypothetical protein BWK78_00365 [Thiotrichaceae bacterium IS1]|nr:MAG: hypothetical protein BWK78_00365 [Thiotrichaceae bacterium IS1]